MPDQSGVYYGEERAVLGLYAGPKHKERLHLVYTPATPPEARVRRGATLQIWCTDTVRALLWKATIPFVPSGELRNWAARLLTGTDGQLVPIELDAIMRAQTKRGSFVLEVRSPEGDESYRILQVYSRLPVRS